MDPRADELIARLRNNPDDQAAFGALRDHYARLGDDASLCNLLEGFAQRMPNPDDAANTFLAAAQCAHRLRDAPRAVALYEQCLARIPEHADAARGVADVLLQAGEHPRLVQSLEWRAKLLQDLGRPPGTVALVELDLGQVWEHELRRPDRAIAHYRKAFELDPTLVPALFAAREIYRHAGNLKAAAALFEREIAAEPEVARRVALLRELAHLRKHDLGDLDSAIRALESAVALGTGDAYAVVELADALWQRAEAQQAPVGDPDLDRVADLYFSLAENAEVEDAIAHCESALSASPAHEAALALLEQVADRGGRPELLPARWVGYLQHAAESPGAVMRRRNLAQAYLQAGQVEDACAALEPLLDLGMPEIGEQILPLARQIGNAALATRAMSVALEGMSAEARIPHLRDLMRTHDVEGREAEAVQHARELLMFVPSDPQALDVATRGSRRTKDFGGIRDLLLAAARDHVANVTDRIGWLREAATLSEETLEDLAGAIEAHREILRLTEGDAAARAALERLLEEAERWDELVEHRLEDARKLDNPRQAAAIHKHIAEIHRRHRNDDRAAIASMRAALELVPGEPATRNALVELLLAHGDALDAVPLFREQIAVAASDPAAARALRLRLAKILEERVENVDGARTVLAEIVDLDPGDVEALSELERLDVARGDKAALLDTLEKRLAGEPADGRTALRRRIADLARETGAVDRAIGHYRALLDDTPADYGLLETTIELMEDHGAIDDIVALFRARADAAEAGARVGWLRRIAQLRLRSSTDRDATRSAWRDVLAAAPADIEALSELIDLTEDPEERASLLGRLAEVVEDPDARVAMLEQQVELLEGPLGRSEEAIGILERIVELRPDHAMAIAALVRLADAAGDHVKLADALEKELALFEDPDLRLPIARRLANLYTGPLPSDERATAAFDAWIAADEADREPRQRQLELLEQLERFEALRRRLDELASLVDPADALPLVRRAAAASLRHGDVDGAWARLVPRLDEDAECDATLREIAEEHGRWPALAERYVEGAKRATDPATQRTAWARAAGAYEKAGDATRALEAMLRAFAADLDDRAMLDDVDRLAAGAGAYARLGQVYDTLLRRATTNETKLELLARQAKTLEAYDASAALDRAFLGCQLAPLDDEWLARAEHLAAKAGRQRDLFAMYAHRCQEATDPAKRRDSIERIWRLALTLGDAATIDRAVELAAEFSRRDADSLDHFVQVAVDLDEAPTGPMVRRLIEQIAAQARRAEERADRASGLAIAGRLERDQLEEPLTAFKTFSESVIASFDDTVLNEIEALAAATGQGNDLEGLFSQLVDEALDAKTATAALRRHGGILETLGRPADAADVYRRLLPMVHGDHEVLARLHRCLHAAGLHQDLLIVLDREVNAESDPKRRLALLKEVALIWERDLGNRWEAMDAWRRVRGADPDDLEAQDALQRLARHSRIGDGDAMEDLLSEAPPEIEPPPAFEEEAPAVSAGAVEEAREDVHGDVHGHEDVHENEDVRVEAAVASPIVRDSGAIFPSPDTMLELGTVGEAKFSNDVLARIEEAAASTDESPAPEPPSAEEAESFAMVDADEVEDLAEEAAANEDPAPPRVDAISWADDSAFGAPPPVEPAPITNADPPPEGSEDVPLDIEIGAVAIAAKPRHEEEPQDAPPEPPVEPEAAEPAEEPAKPKKRRRSKKKS